MNLKKKKQVKLIVSQLVWRKIMKKIQEIYFQFFQAICGCLASTHNSFPSEHLRFLIALPRLDIISFICLFLMSLQALVDFMKTWNHVHLTIFLTIYFWYNREGHLSAVFKHSQYCSRIRLTLFIHLLVCRWSDSFDLIR